MLSLFNSSQFSVDSFQQQCQCCQVHQLLNKFSSALKQLYGKQQYHYPVQFSSKLVHSVNAVEYIRNMTDYDLVTKPKLLDSICMNLFGFPQRKIPDQDVAQGSFIALPLTLLLLLAVYNHERVPVSFSFRIIKKKT